MVSTLLPSVIKRPPKRWRWSLGNTSDEGAIRDLLDTELANAFGSADDVFQDMKVSLIFKGVTYECLSDPEFIEVASRTSPSEVLATTSLMLLRPKREKMKKKLIEVALATGSN